LIVLIKQELQAFSTHTFSRVNLSPYNAVLKRHDCELRLVCNEKLQQKMQSIDKHLQQQLWIIIACLTVLVALLLIDNRKIKPYTMLLLLSACLLLLGLGVVTPMIEIEAQISKLEFQLLGEAVNFSEQVVYYQNKSITDVVLLLLQNTKPQVILVGCLIFLFSIIFPLLKLICSAIYYYDLKGLKSNAWIKFFALKSGKWSMADVWVVALFMAYMGFDGLVGSQLAQLEQASTGNMKVLTTNGTELKAGFYLFLAFCLSSLFLAVRIEASVINLKK
ncbi:MAG: paraquat-inducible protein A, partial [Methylococcaceae bacterium]|nr:paraquat-inducible protein A [Methylococcaceae bacterium]